MKRARLAPRSRRTWGWQGARPLRCLVRAGLRGARVARGLEGLTAAAARDGVRVAEGEAAAHEGVDEVDLAALDVHRAHRVDDDLDAVVVDDRVAFLDPFGEGHSVREAGPSARRDV